MHLELGKWRLCSGLQTKSARELATREGFWGLWRGAPAVVAGAGPAHAIYFGVYENSKHFLIRHLGQADGSVNHLAVGLSGVFATASSEAIFTPADVIKQRIQVRIESYQRLLWRSALILIWDCLLFRPGAASQWYIRLYKAYFSKRRNKCLLPCVPDNSDYVSSLYCASLYNV